MQTAQFACGHCRQLMAVGPEFLGHQVRCPHCLGVVIAPAQLGDNSPPPLPAEADFSATTIDTAAAASLPPSGHGLIDEMPPLPLSASDLAWTSLSPETHGGETPAYPAVTPESMFADSAASLSPGGPDSVSLSPPTPRADSDLPAPDRLARPTRTARRRSWLIPMLLFSLASYSVLATLLAVLLYFKVRAAPHPLEYLPDVEGDHPGAQKRKSSLKAYPPAFASQPLPERLCVPLHGKIQVGALQVEPLGLARRFVTYSVGSARPEPCRYESLVLRLRLTNTSPDQTFYPLDSYFTRRWKEGSPGQAPFTQLQAGDRHFPGGLAAYPARGAEVTLTDSHYDRPLGPGESMETYICTDGEDQTTLDVFRLRGPFLWRVQVRRGLVPVNGREVPAAAVIGVRFSAGDVPGERRG